MKCFFRSYISISPYFEKMYLLFFILIYIRINTMVCISNRHEYNVERITSVLRVNTLNQTNTTT